LHHWRALLLKKNNNNGAIIRALDCKPYVFVQTRRSGTMECLIKRTRERKRENKKRIDIILRKIAKKEKKERTCLQGKRRIVWQTKTKQAS
jgi:hypothetical protein